MNRGLIEGDCRPESELDRPLLPRFMNRGLIEGTLPAVQSQGYSDILPRFMNRGLIEGSGREATPDELAGLPRFMNRGLIEGEASAPSPAASRYFPDS